MATKSAALAVAVDRIKRAVEVGIALRRCLPIAEGARAGDMLTIRDRLAHRLIGRAVIAHITELAVAKTVPDLMGANQRAVCLRLAS